MTLKKVDIDEREMVSVYKYCDQQQGETCATDGNMYQRTLVRLAMQHGPSDGGADID
jgi:hypothetical protein